MGLFSQAVKTYDLMEDQIGILKEDDNYFPLLPLYHVKKKIEISILLKEGGILEGISRISENGIIPSTEAAQGRTSGIAPFPLIECLQYFVDNAYYDAYKAGVKSWHDFDSSNIAINTIYTYLSKGTIIEDLIKAGISISKDEQPNDLKKMIGWVVETRDCNIKTWNDKNLIDSYTQFFRRFNNNSPKYFCMISGKDEVLINNVPSIPRFGLAKLISSNDTSDFSFRGRFIKSEEALSIGYDTTQKAINALSWLCGNQYIYIGKSILLCWNPNGIEIHKPTLPLISAEVTTRTYSNYKKGIENYILEKTNNLEIAKRDVVTVIFDNATKGRLSIKFYSELSIDDFMHNLANWDKECCWIDSVSEDIKSPRLDEIIKYAFGSGESFRTDNKIFETNFPILVERRVSNGRIPTEIYFKLINKCSNLQIYPKDGYWAAHNLLFTTCAVIRKYLHDYENKEFNMALEKEKKDRSYQYGRLLAVLEKIELDTLSDTDTKRISNAIRMQSMFIKRPGTASKLIIEKLKAGYYPKFTGSKSGLLIHYEQLIGEIMDVISTFSDDGFDKPLRATYIMGYYLQKNELYKKKNDNSEVN